MSGDPEQEYFADGMVEEIITALSRDQQLFVIARNSSFTFKGRAVDIKQVARDLAHWLPRSATGRHFHRGAVLRPGLGWCRSSTRPAARTGSAASPSRAIASC